MKGYVDNIERATLENEAFRRVLYTAEHMQLVVMTVPAFGEIGEEVHDVDQFIRIEEGEGVCILDGTEQELKDGSAVVIPAGTRHNVKNMSSSDALKLYSLYAPPHHKDGVVHATKQEADEDDEHFDGKTTP
jgi:mannose-6-phosphate isomerase-like protein (cupin superfamily)